MDAESEDWTTVETSLDGINYAYQYKARVDGVLGRWICRSCAKAETFRPTPFVQFAIKKAKAGINQHHREYHLLKA